MQRSFTSTSVDLSTIISPILSRVRALISLSLGLGMCPAPTLYTYIAPLHLYFHNAPSYRMRDIFLKEGGNTGRQVDGSQSAMSYELITTCQSCNILLYLLPSTCRPSFSPFLLGLELYIRLSLWLGMCRLRNFIPILQFSAYIVSTRGIIPIMQHSIISTSVDLSTSISPFLLTLMLLYVYMVTAFTWALGHWTLLSRHTY